MTPRPRPVSPDRTKRLECDAFTTAFGWGNDSYASHAMGDSGAGAFPFDSVGDETQAAKRMSLKMKTISYRGGVVCFHIPSHWREEYEPEGGGTFYDDRPDSGTLRLNVLSFESNNGEPSEQGAQRAFFGSNSELLPCGLPLRRRTVEGKEGGTAIHLHRWEVAVPVPPTGLRIICFAHTVLAGQESDPAIAAELELIDRSVRNAEFSREQGVCGDSRQS